MNDRLYTNKTWLGNEREYLELKNGTKIHKTAIVEPWVEFEDNCIVRPYAIIGRLPENSLALARQPIKNEKLIIGKNTKIGCHAVIYSDVEIGNDCLIGDYASIREGTRIGNLCVIGRQVTVHYDVKILDECRFMDGTHITGGCEVGKGCFFGVGVITSNDKNVDLNNYHFPTPNPPIFGERVMVGSGANILAGVKVGNDVIIGAGALVVKDVKNELTILGPIANKTIPHIWV